jgi:HSP20 family protein
MRSLISWSPARELSVFSDEFDGLVRRLFADQVPPTRGARTYPRLESFLKDGNFVVRADLPGIDPKKVEVTLEKGYLRIRGEREQEHEHKDHRYHYREVAYGRFEREIALPEGADPDAVTASYRDGVLEIVTKIAAETPKRIDVTVH